MILREVLKLVLKLKKLKLKKLKITIKKLKLKKKIIIIIITNKLQCWYVDGDWRFARFVAPVITTTSIFLFVIMPCGSTAHISVHKKAIQIYNNFFLNEAKTSKVAHELHFNRYGKWMSDQSFDRVVRQFSRQHIIQATQCDKSNMNKVPIKSRMETLWY